MTKPALFGLWVILFAICFFGVDRDLWTPDEPREAEISREMFLTPSIVPSLNGETFVEKPPLYYWAVAGVFALLGEPSAAAARAVSGLASFLTLVLVFFWGRREFSAKVGLIAAFGLATSAQFLITSHWVLIDPLLMLFTTVALFAATELVRGRSRGGAVTVFYAALVLALWSKGLIGPVLVASGLVAYALIRRSLEPLKRVRPVLGLLILAGASSMFAALLGLESGTSTVREWFWINHVQRFLDPTDATGHDQPFYYYVSTIPTAVLPWIVPFVAALRPSTWKSAADPERNASRDTRVFFGALCLGMAVILSASATKRAIYLLPMLPPLFILLGAIASEWWTKHEPLGTRTWTWTSQLAIVVCFAAAPAAIGLIYLRIVDPIAITFLAAVVLLWMLAAVLSKRGQHKKALLALGGAAVSGMLGLLGVAVHLASPTKDLTPFVEWVNEQDPGSQPFYVVGDFDETIRGIVPFVTGRPIVHLSVHDVDAIRPRIVLVHVKDADRAPALEPTYDFLDGRRFGPERYMALWQRHDGAGHRNGRSSTADGS